MIIRDQRPPQHLLLKSQSRNVGDYITTDQRLRQKLPVSEDVENVFVIDHDFCDTFCGLDEEKLVILWCLKNIPASGHATERMNEDCMNGMRRTTLGVITLMLITLSGCSNMLHELQPHRLWRLNYQPQSGNSDGSYGSYFSVDDPLDKTMKTDSINEPAAE